MLAVLLAVDADGFPIEQEDAAGRFRIRKNNPCEVMVEILQNRNVALCTRCPDPAIGAAIEDVAIMKSRSTFSAPAFHAESALAGIASPAPTTEKNGVP